MRKASLRRPSYTPEFITLPQEGKFDSFKRDDIREKSQAQSTLKYINEIQCLEWRYKIALKNQSCGQADAGHAAK